MTRVSESEQSVSVTTPRLSRATLPSLCLVVLSFLITQSLVIPVLPVLSEAMGIGPVAAGWIVTINLLIGSVLVPIMGSLGDRFGHRRVLSYALMTMTAASVLAACAPNLETLLLARAIQAAGTGAFPLALTIVQLNYSGNRQRSAIGWLAGIFGLGAALALVAGGVVADLLGWRGLFGTMAVMGVVAVLANWFLVPGTPGSRKGSVDWGGAAVFVGSLSCLLLSISQGNAWGWTSWPTLTASALGVVGMVILVIIESRICVPLLDIHLLVRGNLGLVNMLAFLLGFVSFVTYVVFPVILLGSRELSSGLQLSPVESTMSLLPNAVAVFIGGRIATMGVQRLGDRFTSALAMSLVAVGAAGAAIGHQGFWSITVSNSVIGLGVGIGSSCCAQFVPRLVANDAVATALGVNTMLRTAGQACGTAVAAVVLTGIALNDSGFATSATYTVGFMLVGAVSAMGAVMCTFIRLR